MTELAIEVIDVAKTFSRSSPPALAGVSFSARTGSVLGLLGPNGAGKTTTINILSTLSLPSSGQARVSGFDVVTQDAAVREAIGLTGQYAAVDEMLTGRENLVLFGRLRGLSRAQARRRAEELLDQFSLSDAADRRVGKYSGGMRRRVDIACGLVVPPRVLFLDEPTTGLDPRSRQDVWALVSRLRDDGITVLLTTQYLEEADALADDIVVIDHGTVIASGSPEELKHRVGGSFCQVTPVATGDLGQIAAALSGMPGLEVGDTSVSLPAPDGLATLAEVFRRIEPLDVAVADVALRRPSLDEVFFRLTGAGVGT
ncbi:daunorubicin/doxorubicin resistance ABC transporter ATP-binding protein DrrA [Mycobacterium sp. M26]|uniref:daunorubicin/doxorubicin resistance ABC transporter ATP-binding protein DrrA n=1 Tax=Mycobacterium sp. M26 TaxID=1762962 RepID=UPI00073F9066|nr:daunorubicin/doxorubicin resistance ABC transporter ATP-binding protein DrrA [Mycobacterium sp. M26]